ncbi:hypothetical protein ABN034_09115 [Actinopolymorpha sp. B11F2]|uniref:WXG100-like domain-containing protein n=1 Tax=Actinopolymorpha sp. B11F2 TaxID=3160862 RepID=UPI0032E3CC20
MGLQLPGELVGVLGVIGINWPEADEEKLFKMGQTWLEFSGNLGGISTDAEKAALQVWTGHEGPAVEAFKQMWDEHGGTRNLDIASNAGMGFGLGLFLYAAIVLLLKINAMIQLVILAIAIAQAIATAVATFGASLVQIPIFRQITKTIIETLLESAIWQVIG